MAKQTQTQVSKTQAPKRARNGKPAPKVETPVEAPVVTQEQAPQEAAADAPQATETQATAPKTLRFHIGTNRPGNGSLLFAHTAAFLSLSGLRDGKAVPVALAQRVIGHTAVKYHCDRTGAFAITKEGLTLAKPGHFDKRGKDVRADLVAAYEALMADGTASDTIHVKPEHIKAIEEKKAAE